MDHGILSPAISDRSTIHHARSYIKHCFHSAQGNNERHPGWGSNHDPTTRSYALELHHAIKNNLSLVHYVCVCTVVVGGVAKLKSSNPGLYDTPSHILQSRRNILNLSTEQESADFSQKIF